MPHQTTLEGHSVNHETHNFPDSLPNIDQDVYDIVIIGAGPAGLMLSTSLARLGRYAILCVDERPFPTKAGRADGIQPRTLEVLNNMNPLGQEIQARANSSYERTFWHTTEDLKGITRARRSLIYPQYLELQNIKLLGLQQGLIEQSFLQDMERRGQRVTRPWTFKSVTVAKSGDYPVTVELEKVPSGLDVDQGSSPCQVRKVAAKYMIGCDGGRSTVRRFLQAHHGLEMTGDWVDTVWGAVDAVVKTSFPDIRKVSAIQSASRGAMLVFPREPNADGQPVVRIYTQVDKIVDFQNPENPWEARQEVTLDMILQADKEIMAPYILEFEKVEWWTAYPVAQRLVSRFALGNNRILLAGDACHTHSPKAGQGLNTSLMDSHNLSFKLHYVLSGMGQELLLEEYHTERWKVAKQLIDFDMEYAALFAGQIPKNTPEVAGFDREQLKAHFLKIQRQNAAFTCGAGVFYSEGATIVPNDKLETRLGLEPIRTLKLTSGWRLVPARVTRCVNSEPVDLVQEIQFDSPGSFRLYVLTGDVAVTQPRLESLSAYLQKPNAFTQRFKAPIVGRPLPSVLNNGLIGFQEVNPWFSILTIVKRSSFDFDLEDYQSLTGLNAALYADDLEECGEICLEQMAHIGGAHIKYGLPEGGIVVVRPDGYVGVTVPLTEVGWLSLETYFNGFLKE